MAQLLLPHLFGRLQAYGTRRVQVVVQLPGHVLDDLLSLHTVAGFIQRRSEDRDGPLAGHNRHNAAADAALRRKTDVPGPTAGAVIEARRSEEHTPELQSPYVI